MFELHLLSPSPSKCHGMRPSSIHLSAAAYLRMLLLQKLKDAKPLTQPMCYAGTSNVRRFYENVKLPDRLFVLGDSAAAFNPVRCQTPGVGSCIGSGTKTRLKTPAASTGMSSFASTSETMWLTLCKFMQSDSEGWALLQVYGQGMTVSAVEAEALHNLLKVMSISYPLIYQLL